MEAASHQTVTFQDLPPEVIINCLQFLDLDDLLDCRLVSHQFNNLVLSSKEIMRKLTFVIQSDESSGPDSGSNSEKFSLEQDFMQENLKDLLGVMEAIGPHIRRIKLKSLTIIYLMGLLPNLEELTIDECLTYFRVISSAMSELKERMEDEKKNKVEVKNKENDELVDLPQLESLMIFNNLKELTVEISMQPDFEVLTDFVAQQPNLKQLIMKFDENVDKIDFPTSDITSKVTFQLKNFEFHTAGKQNESQHFNSFFEGQAEFLDSLSIDFNPDEDLGEIIIKSCTNLKTFSLMTAPDDDFPVFTGFRAYWKLPSVTTLISKVMINHKFSSIAARFPNLSKLKCETMCIGKGKYESITEIETDNFDCEKMQNCSFPNLESLEVKMLHGTEVNHFRHFLMYLIKVESIIVSDTNFDKKDFSIIDWSFRHLSGFCNLRYWNFVNKETTMQ